MGDAEHDDERASERRAHSRQSHDVLGEKCPVTEKKERRDDEDRRNPRLCLGADKFAYVIDDGKN
ncbi:hypothetical protein SDC9_139774 [bioreactor metagenome]|uniref:Uncharacterized protein n=1 Tax=bioreactor metagenome TaxID=1076179 RepID=A0A645DTN1_9ZZZZ